MEKERLRQFVIDGQARVRTTSVIHRDPVFSFSEVQHLSKAVAVVGPRRAGKTFYLFQIIKELAFRAERVVFLDFSELNLSEFRIDDFELLVLVFQEVSQDEEPVFFFDEIHEVAGFERGVTYLLNRGYQVFLTGSSSGLTGKDIASTLRGKTLTARLYPLSFREFLRFRGLPPFAHPTTEEIGRLQANVREYLSWGGFPEVVLTEDETSRRAILSGYIDSMLLRDIVERHGVRNPRLATDLFVRLVRSFTKEFSISKMFNDFKSTGVRVSKDSLYRMVDCFTDTFFISTTSNRLGGVTSPKKVFLADNGLYRIVRGVQPDFGKMLENQVFVDMCRSGACPLFAKSDRFEMDFVTDEEVVQVCWSVSDENAARELGAFQEMGRSAPSLKPLMICDSTSFDQRMLRDTMPPDLRILPYWRWALGM